MNIFYLKKCACPTSEKLDFADKIVKFMEIWKVRSRERKHMQTKLRNSWKSGRSGAGDEKQQFEYLLFEKMRLCPTSKKLDFADKIVKFMEIWEVRSRGRKKTI